MYSPLNPLNAGNFALGASQITDLRLVSGGEMQPGGNRSELGRKATWSRFFEEILCVEALIRYHLVVMRLRRLYGIEKRKTIGQGLFHLRENVD